VIDAESDDDDTDGLTSALRGESMLEHIRC